MFTLKERQYGINELLDTFEDVPNKIPVPTLTFILSLHPILIKMVKVLKEIITDSG